MKGRGRKLVTAEAAEVGGVSAANWRGWRSRGLPRNNPVPPPDGEHDKRTPWWWERTVLEWRDARPSTQSTSDLESPALHAE